jgi:ribosomal protein S27E
MTHGTRLRSVEEHNQIVLALKPRFCGSRRRVMTGIACPQCGAELSEAAPPQRTPSSPALTKVECKDCGYEGNVFTV